MEDHYTIQQPRPRDAKDFSIGGKDYKKMVKANAARTEESCIYNTNWKPGSLDRLDEEFNYEEFAKKWDKRFGKGSFKVFEAKWNKAFGKDFPENNS